MKEEKVLALAKLKISQEFDSINKAAASFGVTGQALSQVLNGRQKYIPKYLLDFVGYRLAEPNYVKVKK